MHRHHLRLALAPVLALLLISCDSNPDPIPGRVPVADPKPAAPQWSEIVSSHTAGDISRDAEIHVRFHQDVAPATGAGGSAEAAFEIEPAIAGAVTFESMREIVFRPAEPFVPGQRYLVRLSPSGLADVPQELDPYEFTVDVIARDFEITVTGLTAVDGSADEMALDGWLETADREDAELIESVLSASFLGRDLEINWRHDDAGKVHEFWIEGIQRQTAASKLRLEWDGAPLEVEQSGHRDIDVPAIGVFELTDVRVGRDTGQHVELRFSDPIDDTQDLAGLVELSEPGVTLRVVGNTVLVFPARPLSGEYRVRIHQGLRNAFGFPLGQQIERTVYFASEKPKVRFAGAGNILPRGEVLAVPFEAVNVDSVQVTAMQVYADNVGQFLQSNNLDGAESLHYVGRVLWRRTIDLPSPEIDRWSRYSVDLSDLLRDNPGALFRLTISINRSNSVYSCTAEEDAIPVAGEEPARSWEDRGEVESSGWDYAEDWYQVTNWQAYQRDRTNPCRDAYYRATAETRSSVNVLASDIGLLAKRGEDGRMLVVATDLVTAQPLPGTRVEVRNFQGQIIANATTDGMGFVSLDLDTTPFYVVARRGGQVGYLKTNANSRLATSHFDVGGERVTTGVKGYIYGERGVWRPGDDIHLTFLLEDREDQIPDDHPVTMELLDPQRQVVQTITDNTPVDGFYTFTMRTAEDAPTGTWTARATLGGLTFDQRLKVETVMPNRLRMELSFEPEQLRRGAGTTHGSLFAQWLHGADASGLRADVVAQLRPMRTVFTRFADYTFDDPSRTFRSDDITIFEGELDQTGHAEFDVSLDPAGDPPGMLQAQLTTRVFEQGGAFSIGTSSTPFHPYDAYVGLQLPQGDRARGMLLTDVDHEVSLAVLSADGEPLADQRVEVSVYKLDWRWWWDQSAYTSAQFSNTQFRRALGHGTVATDQGGRASWSFRIQYPEWGRYFVRACVNGNSHCAGRVMYVDWPGWAGRSTAGNSAGASAIYLSSDKDRYEVGEVAQIQLPDASQGRALVTIEDGRGVIRYEWVEFGEGRTRYEVPITREMAPNAYVSVTLVQPHRGRDNDRPMRLFGVLPILVNDPGTHLQPVVDVPEVWKPESQVTIGVSEEQGRAMTYTLAVVDEGLLGLTNYRTPDPHDRFYRREALGVRTWDLFDFVAGAYDFDLDRLLSLGGGDDAGDDESRQEQRFPPVVRFLGPFTLAPGRSAEHQVDLPMYIGAVRVMVVAAHDEAYGSAERSVIVREPVSLLATVPRVLGPDEMVSVPVSVFVFDEGIHDVTVEMTADDRVELIGDTVQELHFDEPGEMLGSFQMRVRPGVGWAHVAFEARAGDVRSESEIAVQVRTPNPATQRTQRVTVAPGRTVSMTVAPHGLPGTNAVSLEVTDLPPFDLNRRLTELIRYPHGCVEQTTSAVFPQLYIGDLMALTDERSAEIEAYVNIALDRLRSFQTQDGGFRYWPGGWWATSDQVNDWATNYVGHFLIEAKRRGYVIPDGMLDAWARYQRDAAHGFVLGDRDSTLIQAYRLYTLALADHADLGAMNRLRETQSLEPVVRWYLASAYELTGLRDVAVDIAARTPMTVAPYRVPGRTYGSAYRDQAIMLQSLALLGERGRADELAREIAAALSSSRWLSTQTTAYSLMALSSYAGGGDGVAFGFQQRIAGQASEVEASHPVYTSSLADFPDAGAEVQISNTSDHTLNASVTVEGVPPSGQEQAASNGLTLDVRMMDLDGRPVDAGEVAQGTDMIMRIEVVNRSGVDIEDLALAAIFPSGWEIHNPRFQSDVAGAPSDADYQDVRDDRVYTYFDLADTQHRVFNIQVNAAYLGRFYMPGVHVEAMYDADLNARTTGRWVSVVRRHD